jgi:hypothetical protein
MSLAPQTDCKCMEIIESLLIGLKKYQALFFGINLKENVII